VKNISLEELNLLSINDLYHLSQKNLYIEDDHYVNLNNFIKINGCYNKLTPVVNFSDNIYSFIGAGKDTTAFEPTYKIHMDDKNCLSLIFNENNHILKYAVEGVYNIGPKEIHIPELFLRISDNHFHYIKSLSSFKNKDPVYKLSHQFKIIKGDINLNIIIASVNNLIENKTNKKGFVLGRMSNIVLKIKEKLDKKHFVLKVCKSYLGDRCPHNKKKNRDACLEYLGKLKGRKTKRVTLQTYKKFCLKIEKAYKNYYNKENIENSTKKYPVNEIKKIVIPKINSHTVQLIHEKKAYKEKVMIGGQSYFPEIDENSKQHYIQRVYWDDEFIKQIIENPKILSDNITNLDFMLKTVVNKFEKASLIAFINNVRDYESFIFMQKNQKEKISQIVEVEKEIIIDDIQEIEETLDDNTQTVGLSEKEKYDLFVKELKNRDAHEPELVFKLISRLMLLRPDSIRIAAASNLKDPEYSALYKQFGASSSQNYLIPVYKSIYLNKPSDRKTIKREVLVKVKKIIKENQIIKSERSRTNEQIYENFIAKYDNNLPRIRYYEEVTKYKDTSYKIEIDNVRPIITDCIDDEKFLDFMSLLTDVEKDKLRPYRKIMKYNVMKYIKIYVNARTFKTLKVYNYLKLVKYYKDPSYFKYTLQDIDNIMKYGSVTGDI